jgi:hypothetical protein
MESEAFCGSYSADESPRTITYIPQFPPEITILILEQFVITPAQLMKPDLFANVTQLIGLALSKTNIYVVQKEMFYGLKNLQVLYLWENGTNSFKSVREALSVPRLQSLNMIGNNLSGSPPENIFRGLQSTVTYLRLARNN